MGNGLEECGSVRCCNIDDLVVGLSALAGVGVVVIEDVVVVVEVVVVKVSVVVKVVKDDVVADDVGGRVNFMLSTFETCSTDAADESIGTRSWPRSCPK